jgi:hypothetical protein
MLANSTQFWDKQAQATHAEIDDQSNFGFEKTHSSQFLHVNKKDNLNPIDKALKQHYESRMLKRNRFTKASLEIMIQNEPRGIRKSVKSLSEIILEENQGHPLLNGTS